MTTRFSLAATGAGLLALGIAFGAAVPRSSLIYGTSRTCSSFFGECAAPCSKVVTGLLFANCYNSPGGCCYGECGRYSCISLVSNPCIRYNQPYFEAEDLTTGFCTGDVRVSCDADATCGSGVPDK
jgi:hypothetical protein